MNKQTTKVSKELIHHTTQWNYQQDHEYLKSYINISTQSILDMFKKQNKI
jgi:hypothetical protein